jgi:hypothetical protein
VGHGTGSVTVIDTAPPGFAGLPNLVVEATSAQGATASYNVTAADVHDGPVMASCTPASGSTFGVGANDVTCTAVDAAGNVGTGHGTIAVVDTTAPLLAPISNVSASATSFAGAIVSFGFAGVDLVDGSVPAVCSPASGSTFPIGQMLVTCTATDHAGNFATRSFTVTVTSTFSAKQLLQATLFEMQSVPPINANTDRKLTRALGHLVNCIASPAWVDEMHITGASAGALFDDCKQAVLKLYDVQAASPALGASIDRWINAIVDSNRLLATTSISEGGRPAALTKAQKELSLGDADRAAGSIDTALSHYEAAWKSLTK